MALLVADRVKETTTTNGTGSVTLAGAVTGYQSFAVIGNGNTTYYCIADQGGANWEVGIGTYSTTGPTLARTTVLASSNSNALVSFTTGTKDVFVTYPAEKSINTDASGKISAAGNGYVDYASASPTVAAGRMWYDGTDGTWNLGMGGGNITQQVGEELFVYGKASAAITDSPLQIVYQTGVVGASGVITFAPTVAGITDGNLILGCATEAIANNGFGRITTYGTIHGITTNGTAFGETWADGDVIWYNPVTGNPTKVKPVAPNIKVQLGIVTHAGNGGSGSFFVLVNTGSILGGTDSNVQLTSVANNDLLQYYAAGGYWRNIAASTIIAPAGSNTQVQYNNSGAFGASSSFTFDGTALTAPVQISSNGITVNSATVSATYSIPSGSNGMSAGPVSVATGITVTVPTGSTWVIV